MNKFKEALLCAYNKEVLTKLVFSKPMHSDTKKVVCRLCAHRASRLLAAEYYLPGDTVSQRNVREGELDDFIDSMLKEYGQANLITTMGDAELKRNRRGEYISLGTDKLIRKMSGEVGGFAIVPDSLDNKKKHILSGGEDFLIKLGISDKNGRVHDKRQGKFRQINRFLEYIEDIYSELPESGEIRIYDLCCGKSYLSFAVYYYLHERKCRDVYMLGIDLKGDVMDFCNAMAREMGFTGMHFITDNIENTPCDNPPDMVISLHACDIATDIVLQNAVRLHAKVILSTPCCHKHLSDIIDCAPLGFVTKYPKLRGKLCEAITDALRLEYLRAHGYSVNATELTDPDDTPKNTLLRAILRGNFSSERYESYENLLKFTLGEKCGEYLLK